MTVDFRITVLVAGITVRIGETPIKFFVVTAKLTVTGTVSVTCTADVETSVVIVVKVDVE